MSGVAVVTRHIDGDTIAVKTDQDREVTIRLAGIDCPETKHPRKHVEGFGPEASAAMSEMLPIGASIARLDRVDSDERNRDRNGNARVVAYIFREEETEPVVHLDLVTRGLAVATRYGGRVDQWTKQLEDRQAIAQEQGVGVWSLQPEEEREKAMGSVTGALVKAAALGFLAAPILALITGLSFAMSWLLGLGFLAVVFWPRGLQSTSYSSALTPAEVRSNLARHWPQVCDDIGELQGKGQSGRARMPELLESSSPDPDLVVLVIRPRGTMSPDQADALANKLRRHRMIRGRTSRVRETSPGVWELTIGLAPLPFPVAMPDPLPQLPGGLFHLGVLDAAGTPALLDIFQGHVLVVGRTNFGKGGVIRAIMAQVLVKTHKTLPWRLVIFAGKGSGEFTALAERGADVIGDQDSALATLHGLQAEMLRRRSIVDRAGVDNWKALEGADLEEHGGPVVVVFDEVRKFLGTLPPGSDLRDSHREAATIATDLATLARAYGLHLIVVTQRADVDVMGEEGGLMLENLLARISVGPMGMKAREMAFPDRSDADFSAGQAGIPGRGCFLNIHPDHGEDIPSFQGAWSEQDELLAAIDKTNQQTGDRHGDE